MSAHERQRLSAFLDGELSPSDHGAVAAHLATCPECRAWLDEIEAVDEATRSLSVETPPGYFEALPARLRARIEHEREARGGAGGRDGHRWTGSGEATGRRSSTRRGAGGSWPAWTWAVAAALLLAVVTPLTLRHAPGEKSPVAPAAPERVPRQSSPAGAPPSEDLASSAPDETPLPVGGTALGRVAPKASAGREEYRRPSAPESPQAPGAGSGDEAAAPAAAAPLSRERTAARSAAEGEGFAAPPSGEPRADAGAAPAEADRVDPRAQARKGALEGSAAQRAKTTLADASGDASPSEPVGPLREELSAAAEPKASESQAASGVETRTVAVAGPDEVAYRRLARDRPTDAAGWRRQREAWRAFAERHPASPHADEARVRTIEAGVAAWRLDGRKADLDRAREDLAAYLDRGDAWLGDRARRALERAPEP